jgi:hypothetical protein
MQPYKQDINRDCTYKQTGGRTQPMHPYLFEDFARIYSTPTPKCLAGAKKGLIVLIDCMSLQWSRLFLSIARDKS